MGNATPQKLAPTQTYPHRRGGCDGRLACSRIELEQGCTVIELRTPRGLPVSVPETESEDPSKKFSVDDPEGFRAYYLENGYAIVRGVFSPAQCAEIRRLWEVEVKPFGGFMYRQATAKAERHVKNEQGWVMNPILNLQSVDPDNFSGFRSYATTEILADRQLGKSFECLLGDTPKVVQSMYFEGNSATWEHQDSYYLDSETVGEMAAAWIAVEDISASAGRFFICPGSHKVKLDDHNAYNNIAESHEGYIQSVVKKIKDANLTIRAPVLKQGDVLFWNSWTIHGSLDSQDPRSSRSSITCHAIPNRKRFLQHQTRKIDLPTEVVNNTHLFKPKDLRITKNRLIFFVECHFPGLFYWLKKRAVLFVLKHKAG
jgi:phytanoyl-CoA hydroxylase